MDDDLTREELERFATWLDGSEMDRAPYLDYFHGPEDAHLCYYEYNPFDMERSVRTAFQNFRGGTALLVRGDRKACFAVRVTECAAGLHDGCLYAHKELHAVPMGKKYQIAGYGPRLQRRYGDSPRLLKGVALMTAVIYRRAAARYPGAVFFTMNRWPAVIRIR